MTPTPNLQGLQTESRNPKTTQIDTVSTTELCKLINNEDSVIPDIVKGCIPTISSVIDALAPRVRHGGRVIYVGAGTSGRLGVLDASEIPPTYSANPAQFFGLIAGGDVALRSAKEGAEDSWEGAVEDLSALELDGEKDALIGIASSGRTPYVLSCLAFAKEKGCVTIGIACSAPSAMSESGNVDFMIEAVTGPEVVTGSTRMKAGTATKMVLNMLSTGVMIRIGKTFGNIMVDVKPTNVKLQIRARRIVREICGECAPKSDDDLDRELSASGRNVKLAAVKVYLGVSVAEAAIRLQSAGGVLANIVKVPQTEPVNGSVLVSGNEHVLCIDGGASKCSAVIISSTGSIGRGESGPCNPTDVGIQGAVSAIQLAIHAALNSWDPKLDTRDLNLREVWIGLAGGDREAIGTPIRNEITKFLRCLPNISLNVTNDIHLLASASGHQLKSDDVIVLIAGTGSVAMRFQRKGDEFQRVGRSGGWGALLGDDGSGFDIGRKAIRAALFQMEERESSDLSNGEAPDALADLVCKHFALSSPGLEGPALLNNILLSADGAEQSITQTKRKIAGCARAVIAAQTTSTAAWNILVGATDNLVHLVRRILGTDTSDQSPPMLVLAGGLMSSKVMRDLMMQKLEQGQLRQRFSSVEAVEDPAAVGARYLAHRAWGSSGGA